MGNNALERRNQAPIDTVIQQRVKCDSSPTGYHEVTLVARADGKLASFNCECDKAAGDSILMLGGVSCFKLACDLRAVAQGKKSYYELRGVSGALEGLIKWVAQSRTTRDSSKETGKHRTALQRKDAIANKWASLAAGFPIEVVGNQVQCNGEVIASRRDGIWMPSRDGLDRLASSSNMVDDRRCLVCQAKVANNYYEQKHLKRPKHRAGVASAIKRAITILSRGPDQQRLLRTLLAEHVQPILIGGV